MDEVFAEHTITIRLRSPVVLSQQLITMGVKKALITGVTGQDGSYLAEFLLEKGYRVYGLQRRLSHPNTYRIDHTFKNPNFATFYGDLSDSSNLIRVIGEIQPDEIYNLGAQSQVRVSFDIPEYTANITGLGALRILEMLRHLKLPTRYYQAGSSEMFGRALAVPQNETTPFNPQSPYGCSKAFAFHITRVYRSSYGLFASNGILFNHESPRRGITFVTRKITRGLSRVALGIQDTVKLGNLDAKRDWGYAKEYVEGMWRILQHHQPDDFVLATEETHSIREFVEEVGAHLGMDIIWEGKDIEERGVDHNSGKTVVEVDPIYFRSSEVEHLLGDSKKAQNLLSWKPKTTFKDLAKLMAEHDFETTKRELESGIADRPHLREPHW